MRVRIVRPAIRTWCLILQVGLLLPPALFHFLLRGCDPPLWRSGCQPRSTTYCIATHDAQSGPLAPVGIVIGVGLRVNALSLVLSVSPAAEGGVAAGGGSRGEAAVLNPMPDRYVIHEHAPHSRASVGPNAKWFNPAYAR